MAKAKTGRRTVKKNAARQASKKKGPAKLAVRKTARPKAVKAKPGHKAVKKPAAKRGRTAAMVKPARKKTAAGKAPTRKVIAPVVQKRPTIPSPPFTEQRPPAAPVAPRPAAPPPPPAPAPRPMDVAPVREAIVPRGFVQGQRVRHRYEHWWGTVVQKLDDLGIPGGPPAPDRYIVTVDGGQIRDDIRPEDLTAT